MPHIFGALNHVGFRTAIGVYINGAMHHVRCMTATNPTWFVARLEGFEPPTHGLEVRSSIHLSYRRLIANYTTSFIFRQDEFSRLYLNSLSY